LWFGKGFSERHGSDEGAFFIVAIVVCPLLFLIGAFGSIVVLLKAEFTKRRTS
jgi:hypothetical protein